MNKILYKYVSMCVFFIELFILDLLTSNLSCLLVSFQSFSASFVNLNSRAAEQNVN